MKRFKLIMFVLGGFLLLIVVGYLIYTGENL